MAMSTAEKQRRYRKWHLGYGGEKERIMCIVSLYAKLQLDRLAHYHAVSQTQMLEEVLRQARTSAARYAADGGS